MQPTLSPDRDPCARRAAAVALLLALVAAPWALADGPGTRIRSGSTIDPAWRAAPVQTEQRCDRLRGESRERCLREVRLHDEARDASSKPSGPESTGMASGSAPAASAASGSSGGASFGSLAR